MLKPLTSLRFVFAFMVFLVHITYSTSTIKVDPIIKWLSDNIFKEGSVGVGFFFTLSGFILAYNYKNKFSNITTTKKRFWIHRFARIYPLHLLTLYLSFPMMYMLYPNSHVSEFLKPFFLNLFLLHSWIFPRIDNFYWGFNSVSWSISDEMFFYLTFPFIIQLFSKQKKIIYIIVIAMCLMLPLTITYGQNNGVHGIWFYFFPLFRIIDFLLGILLYEIYLNLKKNNKILLKYATVLELLTVSIFILFFSFHNAIPLAYRYSCYYWLPIALIILIFSFQGGDISKLLSGKYFIYLGEISYSFYMLHILVIYYFSQLNNSYRLFENYYLFNILLLVFSIFISAVSFEIIEKPFNKYIIRKLGD